jgi:hypothetical protein
MPVRAKEMSAKHGHTRILTASARKRNGKEVLSNYNKRTA